MPLSGAALDFDPCATATSITAVSPWPRSTTSSLADSGVTGPTSAERPGGIRPCWTESNGSAPGTYAIHAHSAITSGCGRQESPASHPEWERLLSSAARLQQILPGAVLSQLESVAGWKTARLARPVQILGSLHGIETGVRQLIRSEPLETTTLDVGGAELTIPTEPEILRIKGVLIVRRNATRDYLDFVALAIHLGASATGDALESFDRLYPQESGESALQQLQAQLANPLPYDLDELDLSEYRDLAPEWRDWDSVQAACGRVAIAVFDHVCEAE